MAIGIDEKDENKHSVTSKSRFVDVLNDQLQFNKLLAFAMDDSESIALVLFFETVNALLKNARNLEKNTSCLDRFLCGTEYKNPGFFSKIYERKILQICDLYLQEYSIHSIPIAPSIKRYVISEANRIPIPLCIFDDVLQIVLNKIYTSVFTDFAELNLEDNLGISVLDLSKDLVHGSESRSSSVLGSVSNIDNNGEHEKIINDPRGPLERDYAPKEAPKAPPKFMAGDRHTSVILETIKNQMPLYYEGRDYYYQKSNSMISTENNRSTLKSSTFEEEISSKLPENKQGDAQGASNPNVRVSYEPQGGGFSIPGISQAPPKFDVCSGDTYSVDEHREKNVNNNSDGSNWDNERYEKYSNEDPYPNDHPRNNQDDSGRYGQKWHDDRYSFIPTNGNNNLYYDFDHHLNQINGSREREIESGMIQLNSEQHSLKNYSNPTFYKDRKAPIPNMASNRIRQPAPSYPQVGDTFDLATFYMPATPVNNSRAVEKRRRNWKSILIDGLGCFCK